MLASQTNAKSLHTSLYQLHHTPYMLSSLASHLSQIGLIDSTTFNETTLCPHQYVDYKLTISGMQHEQEKHWYRDAGYNIC